MKLSEIKELDSKYNICTYPKQNLCFAGGKGNELYDLKGRAYIDFVAGMAENCLGYDNLVMSEALSAQLAVLINSSPLYYNEQQSLLARNICCDTAFTKAFFCNSSIESSLAASTMIRRYCEMTKDPRNTILIVTPSSLSHRYNALQINNKVHIKVVVPELDKFKAALTDEVCAVIIAPLQVDGGFKVISYDFILSSYAMCKSKNALLIYDETSIGIGRTGKLFAYEHYGVQPDMLMVSRGLGGGLPIAAILARGELTDALKPSDQIVSFGSSALAYASANVVIDRLKNGLLDDVTAMGEYLISKLTSLKKYNFVADIRGKGLIVGLELSPQLKAAKIVGQMEKLGFLLGTTRGNVIRFSPPFIITKHEIDLMTESLEKLLGQMV